MLELIIQVVVAGALCMGVCRKAYKRGRVDGCNDTLALFQKPAQNFLDEWYPLGVPHTPPKSALDVMAQLLEPITEL